MKLLTDLSPEDPTAGQCALVEDADLDFVGARARVIGLRKLGSASDIDLAARYAFGRSLCARLR